MCIYTYRMESPDLSDTRDCLCLASRRAARTITQAFELALRGQKLKPTQFTLLAALTLRGPQPIGALAWMIGADRTTLTRNLAVAERDGLIAMERGKDARARIASITAKGRRALNRAYAAWRATQETLTERIGIAAADSLRKVSREMAARNVSRESLS